LSILVGFFHKSQCQCPRLADLNLNPVAGFESSSLQPLTGQPDFQRDLAALGITGSLDF